MAKNQWLEVVADKITSKEISSEIKLDLSSVPKSQREDVKDQVGNFIMEQILQNVGSEHSPIQGKDWPKLSKDYAKEKKAEGFTPVPNLEKTGAMLGALEFKTTSEGVKVGIFGNKNEVAKADGHNNFSGESNIPTRQFLPKSGEKFERDIQDQIQKIIIDAGVDSDVKKSAFKGVESKSELYTVLAEMMTAGLSRTEIKLAVLRSESLREILDDLSLLELL